MEEVVYFAECERRVSFFVSYDFGQDSTERLIPQTKEIVIRIFFKLSENQGSTPSVLCNQDRTARTAAVSALKTLDFPQRDCSAALSRLVASRFSGLLNW